QVHDANALVVDAGQPLAPQIWPPTLDGNEREHGKNNDEDYRHADERKRLVEWNCRPGQPSQHVNLLRDALSDPPSSGRGCARTAWVRPIDRWWAARPCSALPVRRSWYRREPIRCRALVRARR